MKAAHMERLEAGHVEKLDELLASLGGYLFDRYRLDAPADKRTKPKWLEYPRGCGGRGNGT